MADRRMFTKKITESDAFLDMPMSAQALYFHLNMAADDDGFVNNPKKVQRMVGAAADDLHLLLAKNFIINFESGVIVIKHWRMHNLIRSDRYHPTDYTAEKEMLLLKDNNAYTLKDSGLHTVCLPNDNQMETEVRLGKDRLVEERKKEDSSEPSKKAAEPAKKPRPKKEDEPEADVAALILNDGTEWRPTEALFAEYVRLYPNVDVKQQFNVMRGWCLSNKPKRKTRRGITAFVNRWLAKEQDGGKWPRNLTYAGTQQAGSGSPQGYSKDQINKLLTEKREDLLNRPGGGGGSG